MIQRLNTRFMRIFKSGLGLNTSADDTKEEIITKDIESIPQIPEAAELKLESESIPQESDVDLIDIDELMEQKEEEEEEKFIEVKYIDVFSKNKFDGDYPLDQKQIVLRRLLLSDKLELLPDISPTNLLTDEELDLLLKRFRPSELLIILKVWPQLKEKIWELIVSQTFLWFGSNVRKAVRFAPHEDCCDICDHITDLSQSCIQIRDSSSLAQVFQAFNQVSDIFSSLRCLRLFRFSFNEDSDHLISKMCPNLIHLDLTECRVNHWSQLSAQHKQLKHLILNSTAITDNIFSAIVKEKTFLKTLGVNSTKITGKYLSLLPIEIERVDTRCCHQLLPNYIKRLFKSGLALNQLKYLRIEVVFDDKAFALMCRSLKNLILLELRASDRQNTKHFTGNGLKQIGRLSSLRSLKFGSNIAVHTIPLMEIFVGCPLITHFSIDGTNCYVFINEEELSQISDYWPLLRRVEFKNLDSIGKKTIDGLTRLQNLSYLDLTECPSIDDNCFVCNLEKMIKLNYIVLDKCHRLTILTYNSVVEKAIGMESLLSASFYRCNFFIDYIKAEQLPKNLRLTFASNKSKRFMTFDGIRVKILRCEDVYKYFNSK